MSSITVAVLVFLYCAVTGGLGQGYQNRYDGILNVPCNRYRGEAMYAVQSKHDNGREDRIWKWSCKITGVGAMSTCYWVGYQNGLDQPLFFHCPANYVISGVNSYHSNGREDRRWNFYCCRATGFCTKDCRLSNYINNWDGFLFFRATHPWFFTGAFSYHSNGKEDRRWKIMTCKYERC